MTEPTEEERAAFKEKIKTVQTTRQPHVEQKSAEGSTQTYHSSGRVDANIMAVPIVTKAVAKAPDEGATE